MPGGLRAAGRDAGRADRATRARRRAAPTCSSPTSGSRSARRRRAAQRLRDLEPYRLDESLRRARGAGGDRPPLPAGAPGRGDHAGACSTARARRSGTRPRTACTRRRRCSRCCSRSPTRRHTFVTSSDTSLRRVRDPERPLATDRTEANRATNQRRQLLEKPDERSYPMSKFDRRSFLKTAGLATGAAVVGGVPAAAAAATESRTGDRRRRPRRCRASRCVAYVRDAAQGRGDGRLRPARDDLPAIPQLVKRIDEGCPHPQHGNHGARPERAVL